VNHGTATAVAIVIPMIAHIDATAIVVAGVAIAVVAVIANHRAVAAIAVVALGAPRNVAIREIPDVRSPPIDVQERARRRRVCPSARVRVRRT